MPFVGWFDSGTGTTRPFGSEWGWIDSPVGPEMLASIAAKIVNDRAHEWGNITPTTLIATPRQVIIERFMDVYLDPEQAVSMHIGTLIHEGLTEELHQIGYCTDPVELEAFGVKMRGSPDAWWPPRCLRAAYKAADITVIPAADFEKMTEPNPKPFTGMPDIIELKVTTPGSVKFTMEDGEAKLDHRAQANMYRHAIARTYNVDPASLSTWIHYYDMPQKEQVKGVGWLKMPPCLRFPVELQTIEEIGAIHPGYSPPKNDRQYQGSPPDTIAQHAATLKAAVAAIEAGASPVDIVAQLECECPKRFNGQGRSYCNVMRDCAMCDHGTPIW